MRGRAQGSPLAWLGGLLALYLAVPIIALLVRVTHSSQTGFGEPGLWSALRISVESATISTACIAVLGIPLAHWLARSTSLLSHVVGILVQLPLALPPVMGGLVLIYLVGPYTRLGRLFDGGLTDSLTGIVLAQTFVAAPFLVISARSAFARMDPALEDLAATLGHHSLARFWKVAIPVAAPGIRAGLLLTWLRALGEYGATVLLAYFPTSLPVYTYVEFSGSGVDPTQAPTVLALGAAAVAVVVSRLRLPARRHATRLPVAHPPAAREPTLVGFDLDVTAGEFTLRIAHRATSPRLAILGPSGSGKSMTLRSLAGLLGARAGSVTFGSQEVTHVPTERRHLGYVPQGAGVFPNRTVWQQLLFGTDADPHLASWWLQTLRVDGLEDRFPDQLSGGQRQRVALAQALSHRPGLVLLDEPFSALDAPIRDTLRTELRRLQRETGLSTVLVTHDPEEAAVLADEILVIEDGRLLQAGSRAEVFNRPASPTVARLLGIQNLSPAVVSSPTSITCGDLVITTHDHGLPVDSAVLWCIRADRVDVSRHGAYPATVLDVVDVGTLTAMTVQLDDGPELRVRTTDRGGLTTDDRCGVDLDAGAITLWPSTSTPVEA